jgi:hypothetical protein
MYVNGFSMYKEVFVKPEPTYNITSSKMTDRFKNYSLFEVPNALYIIAG